MSDRTLFFLENGRAVARGLTQSADGQWVSTQEVDAVYSYTLDWAGWLAGDTIADASTSGKGVTLQAFAFDDTSVTFQVLAPSADAVLRVQIVSNSGRIDGRALRFSGGSSSARTTVTVLATPVIPGAEWAAGVPYEASDVVWVDGTAAYRARTAHVAGPAFADDLAAGKWTLAVDLAPVTQQIDATKLDKDGDASSATVSAGGGPARPLSAHLGDTPNVKALGAKSDGSTVATTAWNEATAAAASGLVVQVTPGLYDLTGNPPGAPNVGYDMSGVRFSGLAPAYPDWICDPSFYSGASPRAWRALEGAVDRHDGQFGRYVSMRVLDTSKGGTDPSPEPGYMKGAGYFKVITHDKSGRVGVSDPDTVTRDAVALTGAGTIAAGNTLGRAWGLFAHAICEDDADGLLAGLEIDMGNYSGVVQKGYNQPNTKTAVRLFATGHISCGIHFSYDQSGAVPNSRWHHAISIEPTALDSDGYAFRLIGSMAVHPTGKVTVGTDAAPGGEMVKVYSASTPYVNFTDGVRSFNFGIDSGDVSRSTFLNASNGARFLANNGVATAISYDATGAVSLAGAVGGEGMRVTPVSAANRCIVVTPSNGGDPSLSVSGGKLNLASALSLTNQTVGTTVGAAGGASALPATPLGYLTLALNGSNVRIPYYN